MEKERGEKMKRIGIVYDKNKPKARESASLAENWLKKRGYKTYHNLSGKILEQLDFVITFGGDGLVLHTANKIKEYSIPMIRVDFGYVGALTNVIPGAMLEKLSQVFERDNFIIKERTRIEVSVLNKHDCKAILVKDALNDVVIERRDTRSITINVEANEILNEYRGDAIVFATRTGSTAYAESAGGPTLIDEAKFILRVVSPSNRELLPWLIRPNDVEVVFQVERITGKARLVVDGEKVLNLRENDKIVIKKSKKATLFVEIGDMEKKKR
jgi:NAD+ kinase